MLLGFRSHPTAAQKFEGKVHHWMWWVLPQQATNATGQVRSPGYEANIMMISHHCGTCWIVCWAGQTSHSEGKAGTLELHMEWNHTDMYAGFHSRNGMGMKPTANLLWPGSRAHSQGQSSVYRREICTSQPFHCNVPRSEGGGGGHAAVLYNSWFPVEAHTNRLAWAKQPEGPIATHCGVSSNLRSCNNGHW